MDAGSPPRAPDGRFTSVRDYRLSAEDATAMGLPQWAVGRTAAEGFQLAQQLYQQTLSSGVAAAPTASYGAAAQPSQQPTPANAPPSPTPANAPPSSDDWATDPAGAQQRYNDWHYRTQVAPQFAQTAAQQAATAVELVRQQERDIFGRWEPEIMLHLNSVERSLWTPDNIRKVVGLVKAQHLDELATERAETLIRQRVEAGALARPSAGPGAPSAAPANVLDFSLDDLPPERRSMLEGTRLIRDNQFQPAFWEFCDKMKSPAQTREQYAKEWLDSAKQGDVLVSTLGGNVRIEEAS